MAALLEQQQQPPSMNGLPNGTLRGHVNKGSSSQDGLGASSELSEHSDGIVNPLAQYSAQLAQKQLHIRRISENGRGGGVQWVQDSDGEQQEQQQRDGLPEAVAASRTASSKLSGEDGRGAHYFERVKSLLTGSANGNGVHTSVEDLTLSPLHENAVHDSVRNPAGGLQLDGIVNDPRQQSDNVKVIANGKPTTDDDEDEDTTSSGVPTLSTSRTQDHTPNSSPEGAQRAGGQEVQPTAADAASTTPAQLSSSLPSTFTSSDDASAGAALRTSATSTSRSTEGTSPPRAAGPNPTMYLVGSALSTSSTSVLPVAGGSRSPRLATQSFSSSASGSPRKREKTLPSLVALHTASSPAIPQANVIPPTPPSATTSSASPAIPASDAKAGPSREQLIKSSPGHNRSRSHTTNTATTPVASTSTAATAATLSPGAYPPRRSSLLANVSSSLIHPSDDGQKRRALSPKRGLSFRNSISLRQNPVVVDEPLSIEQQEEQQRATDDLNEDIARQAEQIRKERLNKRIETQRAHEKAIAALREERGLSPVPGASPGSPMSGEFNLPPPGPLTPGIGADKRKGKERERGDSFNFVPSSPTSATNQLWASSPMAGEKAQLRVPLEVGTGLLTDSKGMRAGVATSPTSKEKPGEPPEQQPERVLVGNLIGEDHVNYVLMYNMLTGIRIGVSRCEAKVRRPLTDEDYSSRHKFSFDIVGNELTPSARYDFKFKDYAPWVFRELREYFRLDPADYLLSLTAKYILSELGSPGKSGSFFYFSRDYRFIIKTISHTEHKFLRRILKDYYKHVMDNPHTLISRFYGLHRVKLPRGRKIHFVIMNNLFPPHRDIHETYDLKGSSIGRIYPEEKAAENPRGILKDLNWLHRHRELAFGPTKKQLFEEQLKRDVELLQRMGIMDYSLLVGVHDGSRGNSENLRDGMLTVFKPEMGSKLRRRPTHRGELEDASALRRAVQQSDPKALGEEGHKLPYKDRSERKMFLFYQDEGGMRATDENDVPEGTIYYLGIIDILTPYNCKKKIEHAWRSMQYDAHRISAVPPEEYGERFLNFLFSIMRGGDVSRRPKME